MTKSLAEELATPVFTASIETAERTYTHGYHLGTEESMARSVVEDLFKQVPGCRTIGLKYPDGHHAYFDGDWWSDDDKDHRILSARVQSFNGTYSTLVYYIDVRGRVDARMVQMAIPAQDYAHAIIIRNAICRTNSLA